MSIIIGFIALATTHGLHLNLENEMGSTKEETTDPTIDVTDEEVPPPPIDDEDEFYEEEDYNEEPIDEELESNADAALYRAELFEGDIQLTDDQNQFILNGTSNEDQFILNGTSDPHPADERNAMNIASRLWPGRVIPYVFGPGFTSSERARIAAWARDFERYTCVRVVPRSNQRDYVYIIPGSGCSSFVGRTGGRQLMSLQRDGCVWRKTVVHEFLHAAGFWHEQSRSDRDRFVTIHWQNIKIGAVRRNFNRVGLPDARLIGSYDYRSVMHYSNTAFTSNGRKTITLKANPNAFLGQFTSGTMTSADRIKLNALYGCSGSSCTDRYRWCPYWSRAGFCTNTRYRSFMRRYCARSCRAC